MEINHGLYSLTISSNKNSILINGERCDWYGKTDKIISYEYKIGSIVNYKRYETRLKGQLNKINKKSVIINNNGNLIKKDIKHFVINNLSPDVFYRVEHIDSGKGPFQHKFNSINKIQELISERVEFLKQHYYEYPAPQLDESISKVWNILDTSFKRSYTKFACSSESRLNEWFGNELLSELLNNGFIIKEYQRGRDFDKVVYGNNQVLLLNSVPQKIEQKLSYYIS